MLLRRGPGVIGIACRVAGTAFNNSTLDLYLACSAVSQHDFSPFAQPDDWGWFRPSWLAATAHDNDTEAPSVGSLHARDSEEFGTVVVADRLASSLAVRARVVETCGPDKLANARYTWP